MHRDRQFRRHRERYVARLAQFAEFLFDKGIVAVVPVSVIRELDRELGGEPDEAIVISADRGGSAFVSCRGSRDHAMQHHLADRACQSWVSVRDPDGG